jgi:hypothetical protein
MNERKIWTGVVVARQLVANEHLSKPHEDRHIAGEYEFSVEAHCKNDAYENALDWFHKTVPVDCLEDFAFDVRFSGDTGFYAPWEEATTSASEGPIDISLQGGKGRQERAKARMNTMDILLNLSARTGWNPDTMLQLLCEYIDNQQDGRAVRDFLHRKADEEEIYYQPEFDEHRPECVRLWEENNFHDHQVYHSRKLAQKDFPGLKIIRYVGDQIEAREYLDDSE